MSEVLLSICIPTNGRIDILKKTLESIYTNCSVSFDDFEVVLSDNSTNDELPKLLDSFRQYPNIIYSKTNCEGFLNSINALKLGNGIFLKLHNNYTMLTQNGLESLVSFVKMELKNKPFIFFKNSGTNKILQFESFNDFNYELSFWNSWSTGFSVWKEDFNKISSTEVNKMFPHTSLFLTQFEKKMFIINDKDYFVNQEVKKKGGYNLFNTFAVEYIRMMEEAKLSGNISELTFQKIKNNLFYDFLTVWYCNTKLNKNEYSFDLSKIKESMCVFYGDGGFFKLKFYAYSYFIKIKIKGRLKKIIKTIK